MRVNQTIALCIVFACEHGGDEITLDASLQTPDGAAADAAWSAGATGSVGGVDYNYYLFTPAATGATGSNTSTNTTQGTVPANHWAGRPTNIGVDDTLVLLLHGGGGFGEGLCIGFDDGLQQDLCRAAIKDGHRVLSLSHHVGGLNQGPAEQCSNDFGSGTAATDKCIDCVRYYVAFGAMQSGCAYADLANSYRPDLMPPGISTGTSIEERVRLALMHLSVPGHDPAGGWDAFLTPSAAAVDWSHVYVVGHSAGGSHTAYLAKYRPVGRAGLVSSVCDTLEGNMGTTPPSWTSRAGFVTPREAFGLVRHSLDSLCDAAAVNADATHLDIPSSNQYTNSSSALGCNQGAITGPKAHRDAANCGTFYEAQWRTLLF
jgi:hypothetical protein